MNLKDTAVKIYLQTKLAYNTDKQPSDTIKIIERVLSEMDQTNFSHPKNWDEFTFNNERIFLETAIKDANGNISLAAKNSGIWRSHFYVKMQKHGITRE